MTFCTICGWAATCQGGCTHIKIAIAPAANAGAVFASKRIAKVVSPNENIWSELDDKLDCDFIASACWCFICQNGLPIRMRLPC